MPDLILPFTLPFTLGDVFGSLSATWNIEEAVIETLRLWMPEYLAEVERQNGLPKKTLSRPPTPESYRGALDWLSVKDDWLPEVKVICNPVGEPERQASEYIQAFETQVGCVVKSEEGTDPEAIARRNAALMAAASMLLVQHGDLQLSNIEETVLVGAPKVEFLEAEDRRYAVGITTYHIFAEILNPNLGPEGETPETSPGYEGLEEPYKESPQVKTATETIKAVPISEEV